MDISEDKFKLALATDLIIFMTHIWVKSIGEGVDGTTIVNELMNKWSERVESSSAYMKDQIAAQMAEENEEIDKDVAMIMLDITNVHNKTVKGEFKSQMREVILKGLEVYNKQ